MPQWKKTGNVLEAEAKARKAADEELEGKLGQKLGKSDVSIIAPISASSPASASSGLMTSPCVAIGDGAKANHMHSVALGDESYTTRSEEVSVLFEDSAGNARTRVIGGVSDPSLDTDAATKQYVDKAFDKEMFALKYLHTVENLGTVSGDLIEQTSIGSAVVIENTYGDGVYFADVQVKTKSSIASGALVTIKVSVDKGSFYTTSIEGVSGPVSLVSFSSFFGITVNLKATSSISAGEYISFYLK